ncbi:MAG: hypothetical protein ACM37W_10070 [Actinomycetota bacterium]
MAIYRSVLRLNAFCVLLVILLAILTKIFNWSVSDLFGFPFFCPQPTVAILTRTFQLLCAVPVIVCTFSYGLLRTLKPRHPETRFLLVSALLTGAFLVNEIYRIHLYFGELGIPKFVFGLVYALALSGYAWVFRQQIQTTPYRILLAGLGLLFFAIFVDSLQIKLKILASLLEGIPKLFSGINIAIYYWSISKEPLTKL